MSYFMNQDSPTQIVLVLVYREGRSISDGFIEDECCAPAE